MSQAEASGWEQTGRQMDREELLGKKWQSQGPGGRGSVVRSIRGVGMAGQMWQGCEAALGSWGLPRGYSRPQKVFKVLEQVRNAVWRVV